MAVTLIGQIRDGEKLVKALTALEDLQKENKCCLVKGESEKEKFDSLRRIQENDNLIEVSKMLSLAALERTESRGGHYRNDFPEVDEKWECSLVVSQDEEKITVERREIVEENVTAIEPENQPGTDRVL